MNAKALENYWPKLFIEDFKAPRILYEYLQYHDQISSPK